MTRLSIAAALALTVCACAPSTHATAFRQATPKSSADDYGDLIQLARVRAAAMGADAIIVTRDPETRTTGLAYVPAARKKGGQLVTGSGRTIETPRIQVAAIAWKGSEDR